ncbi:MAG: GHKL domain-containing protein [Clostridia bacterium]|nr:GHKL domain-containing protein [Clostridia bacterium]
MLFTTAEVFASVFEIMLSYMLASNYYEPKFRKRNLDFVPFLVIAGGVILWQLVGVPGAWKYVAECAALSAALFLVYRDGVKAKTLGSVVFALLTASSVLLASFVFRLIGSRAGIAADTASPFVSLLKITLTEAFMVFGAILISSFAKANPRTDTFFRLWIGLLAVPAVTLVTFSVFQYYLERYPGDGTIRRYLYISCGGLLFINLLVFILFRRMHRQMLLKRDTDLLTSQLALQEASIKNLETAYNRTRHFRHDIKNHILLMNMLAEQEKYDELKDYLQEMGGVIDESSYVRITGVSAVDAILNEKLFEAQGNSVTTAYDVAGLEDNGVKPLDLCIILSNALDNAIEANGRIADADARWLKLKIHGGESFTVISVANPVARAPQKSGGAYVTSKKDADDHGFGLKSIESTVAKYDGEMLCKCEEGVFTLVVRLNSAGGAERREI